MLVEAILVAGVEGGIETVQGQVGTILGKASHRFHRDLYIPFLSCPDGVAGRLNGGFLKHFDSYSCGCCSKTCQAWIPLHGKDVYGFSCDWTLYNFYACRALSLGWWEERKSRLLHSLIRVAGHGDLRQAVGHRFVKTTTKAIVRKFSTVRINYMQRVV